MPQRFATYPPDGQVMFKYSPRLDVGDLVLGHAALDPDRVFDEPWIYLGETLHVRGQYAINAYLRPEGEVVYTNSVMEVLSRIKDAVG